MIEFQDIVPLVAGMAVLALGAASQLRPGRNRTSVLFGLAFLVLLAGWTASVAENLVAGEFLDWVEHASRALAGLLVAAGCWCLGRRSRKEGR